MANVNITPNMSLPNPVPTVDPDPDWADNLQTCMNIIDAHGHTGFPNDGKQITSAAININGDVVFNGYNIDDIRSVRLYQNIDNLTGTGDLGCIYNFNGDLWYNNASGYTVQITSGNGTATSLGNPLTFPSTATSPTINQATTTSTTGQNITLQAQNAATTGGNVVLAPGTGSTAGGNISFNSSSSVVMDFLNTGLGLKSTTINTTGGSTTLSQAQAQWPVIMITGTLASNATLVFPANSQGLYFILTYGLTGSSHSVIISVSGSGYTSTISTSEANISMVLLHPTSGSSSATSSVLTTGSGSQVFFG